MTSGRSAASARRIPHDLGVVLGAVLVVAGCAPPFRLSDDRMNLPNRDLGLCIEAAPDGVDLRPGDLVLQVDDTVDVPIARAMLRRRGGSVEVVYRRDGTELEALVPRLHGAGAHTGDAWARCAEEANRAWHHSGPVVQARIDVEREAQRWLDEDLQRDARRLLFEANPPGAPPGVALSFGSVASTDAVQLHVRAARPSPVDDDGVVLVLINGGPGKSHDHFIPLERYVRAGHTVVTYDQRGTGLSTRPTSNTGYEIDAHSEDLEAVREWLGGEPIVALGHSWGCLVAADWAARNPDHVAGIVLVDCGEIHDEREHAPIHPFDRAPRVHRLQPSVAPAPARPEPPPPTEPPAHLDPSCRSWWPTMAAYYADGSKLDADALAGTCHDRVAWATWRALGSGYDLRPGLSALDAPALVVYGAADPWTRRTQASVVDSLDRDVTSVTIPDCGHRPMLECPDAFDAALLPFLAETARAAH